MPAKPLFYWMIVSQDRVPPGSASWWYMIGIPFLSPRLTDLVLWSPLFLQPVPAKILRKTQSPRVLVFPPPLHYPCPAKIDTVRYSRPGQALWDICWIIDPWIDLALLTVSSDARAAFRPTLGTMTCSGIPVMPPQPPLQSVAAVTPCGRGKSCRTRQCQCTMPLISSLICSTFWLSLCGDCIIVESQAQCCHGSQCMESSRQLQGWRARAASSYL